MSLFIPQIHRGTMRKIIANTLKPGLSFSFQLNDTDFSRVTALQLKSILAEKLGITTPDIELLENAKKLKDAQTICSYTVTILLNATVYENDLIEACKHPIQIQITDQGSIEHWVESYPEVINNNPPLTNNTIDAQQQAPEKSRQLHFRLKINQQRSTDIVISSPIPSQIRVRDIKTVLVDLLRNTAINDIHISLSGREQNNFKTIAQLSQQLQNPPSMLHLTINTKIKINDFCGLINHSINISSIKDEEPQYELIARASATTAAQLASHIGLLGHYPSPTNDENGSNKNKCLIM